MARLGNTVLALPGRMAGSRRWAWALAILVGSLFCAGVRVQLAVASRRGRSAAMPVKRRWWGAEVDMRKRYGWRDVWRA